MAKPFYLRLPCAANMIRCSDQSSVRTAAGLPSAAKPMLSGSDNASAPAIIVVQPEVPHYRVDFFERLATTYGTRFTVWSSPAQASRPDRTGLAWWHLLLGPIRSTLGIQWQAGALSIPVARGDILVISGAPRCLTNLLLLLKARLKGARTVWWGHYWSSTTRRWRHVLRLQMMRFSEFLLLYTDAEVEELRRFRRFSNKHVVWALNNGIDTTAIEPLRASYSAADRPPSILFLGRITQKSRLDLLITTLADLERVELHVVGHGEGETDLRSLANSLGVQDRVHWHGAVHDESAIAAIANKCRIFVYPGAVGLSLIHAMTYGLPAVLHGDRWKQMPEFAAFSDGQTGRSFELGDASSLAQVIHHLIFSEPELEKMSLEAVATITREGFNTASMARRFEQAIQMILAKDMRP